MSEQSGADANASILLCKQSALDAGLTYGTDAHITYRSGFDAGWVAALSGPDVMALRGLAKDHYADMKRIQDAERALERERARRAILENALEVYAMTNETFPEYGDVARQALEQAREDEDYDPTPWCSGCGAMRRKDCHCGPIAAND